LCCFSLCPPWFRLTTLEGILTPRLVPSIVVFFITPHPFDTKYSRPISQCPLCYGPNRRISKALWSFRALHLLPFPPPSTVGGDPPLPVVCSPWMVDAGPLLPKVLPGGRAPRFPFSSPGMFIKYSPPFAFCPMSSEHSPPRFLFFLLLFFPIVGCYLRTTLLFFPKGWPTRSIFFPPHKPPFGGFPR